MSGAPGDHRDIVYPGAGIEVIDQRQRPFDMAIYSAGGTLLARLFETPDGKLDAEYAEGRVTEAAQQFIEGITQYCNALGVKGPGRHASG